MSTIKITAKQLRVGDILEPDHEEVISVQCYAEKVVLTIKAPGKRQATYNLDPNWPLRRSVQPGEQPTNHNTYQQEN